MAYDKRVFSRQFTDWDRLPVVLDVKTVCCLLRCCEQTVDKYLKNGTFKGNKLGKQWCIDRDSIKNFILGVVTDQESQPEQKRTAPTAATVNGGEGNNFI